MLIPMSRRIALACIYGLARLFGIRGLPAPNVPDWLAFALEWAYVVILAVFIPIASFCIPPLLVAVIGGRVARHFDSSRSTHHGKPSEKSRLAPGNRRAWPRRWPRPHHRRRTPRRTWPWSNSGWPDKPSATSRMHKRGEVASYDPRFAAWERRQVEAIRDAGASRAEFIATLEGYVKRLRDRQRIVEEGYRRAPVPRLDVHDAKYRVLEAEMWLNQEKVR